MIPIGEGRAFGLGVERDQDRGFVGECDIGEANSIEEPEAKFTDFGGLGEGGGVNRDE